MVRHHDEADAFTLLIEQLGREEMHHYSFCLFIVE